MVCAPSRVAEMTRSAERSISKATCCNVCNVKTVFSKWSISLEVDIVILETDKPGTHFSNTGGNNLTLVDEKTTQKSSRVIVLTDLHALTSK